MNYALKRISQAFVLSIFVLPIDKFMANSLAETTENSAMFDQSLNRLQVKCMALKGSVEIEIAAVSFDAYLTGNKITIDTNSLEYINYLPENCEDIAYLTLNENGDIIQLELVVNAAVIIGQSDIYYLKLSSSDDGLTILNIGDARLLLDSIPDVTVARNTMHFGIRLPDTYAWRSIKLESKSGSELIGIRHFGQHLIVDSSENTEPQTVIVKGTTTYGVDFIERFSFQIGAIDCQENQVLANLLCADLTEQ